MGPRRAWHTETKSGTPSLQRLTLGVGASKNGTKRTGDGEGQRPPLPFSQMRGNSSTSLTRGPSLGKEGRSRTSGNSC